MGHKIKIALADDELLFRQGLKSILENEEDIEVLYDAENGSDLMQKLKKAKTHPDIVVTDLKMPELNGVEVTKILTKEFPDIKIIALTSYFSKPFILSMISIGAVAYLAKNSTPKLMIKTIKEVHKNGFYYDKKVLQFVEEDKENKQRTKSSFDNTYFTKRELDVLNLLCRQLNSKDAAEQLGISKRTVEGHRNNLLLKTDSKNTAGLVIYALKNKLINLDEDFL